MQALPINSHRNARLERLRLQLMAGDQAAAIGRRLRERREELSWTRRKLAKETDGLATKNDIYRWESGKHRPQDDTLAALARAMGKTYAWALGEEERKAADTPEPFSQTFEKRVLAHLEAIEEQLALLQANNEERHAELLKRIDERTEPIQDSARRRRPA